MLAAAASACVARGALAQEAALAGRCSPELGELLFADPEKARDVAVERGKAEPGNGWCAAAAGEAYLLLGNWFFGVRELVRAEELLAGAEGVTAEERSKVKVLLCAALERTDRKSVV